MNDLDDHALEQQLGQLQPRGAPRELRQRVLGKLADAQRPALHRQRKPARDRIGNWVTAALVFLAATAWIVNLRYQDRRLAALLGPTPAERRAADLIESIQLVADPEQLQAVHDRLIGLLERPARRPVFASAVDSVSPHRRLLVEWLQNELERHEMETDRSRPCEHPGDTTDRRCIRQLASSRTA